MLFKLEGTSVKLDPSPVKYWAVTFPTTTTLESTVIPVVTLEKFTVFVVSNVDACTDVILDPLPVKY